MFWYNFCLGATNGAGRVSNRKKEGGWKIIRRRTMDTFSSAIEVSIVGWREQPTNKNHKKNNGGLAGSLLGSVLGKLFISQLKQTTGQNKCKERQSGAIYFLAFLSIVNYTYDKCWWFFIMHHRNMGWELSIGRYSKSNDSDSDLGAKKTWSGHP